MDLPIFFSELPLKCRKHFNVCDDSHLSQYNHDFILTLILLLLFLSACLRKKAILKLLYKTIYVITMS